MADIATASTEPVHGRLYRSASRLCERVVQHGAPPAWFGWRWVRHETLDEHFARGGSGRLDVIHEPERVANPLPRNVRQARELPDEPDWFGFSFRDVPHRMSTRTASVTLPDATVATFNDAERDRFWPAVVTDDARALSLREVTYRPGHSRAMRTDRQPVRLRQATWFLERVYENHSHWLTAHLPKLCLLKNRGELDHIVLPARRNQVIDTSLALLGIDPLDHQVHDPSRPLEADELTLLETDRFRPELLRPVREHLGIMPGRAPWRRVFVSRSRASIRRLVNEDVLAPRLKDAGFEIVCMEDLDFKGQIELMGETKVLLAPHGAGLTNMMFCQAGAHVVEIADPAYPNPNFYALASAMGLSYWLVRASLVQEKGRHRLDCDLSVEEAAVLDVLAALEGAGG